MRKKLIHHAESIKETFVDSRAFMRNRSSQTFQFKFSMRNKKTFNSIKSFGKSEWRNFLSKCFFFRKSHRKNEAAAEAIT